MKIGVFDSGIGGVTVLQALRKRFPGTSFAYFGDTAHVPYGTKSATQIRALSESAAARIRDHGVDALVVACNTASSLALSEIAGALGELPLYGMVDAGVRAVVAAAVDVPGPVVVFGTRATVRSGVYAKALSTELRGRAVSEKACPLLVPIIEEGWVDHLVLHTTLREYVSSYAHEPTGVALLACTHYPWIRRAFESALPGWKVVDSADAVTNRLVEDGARLGLRVGTGEAPLAPVEWFFSDPEIAPFVFAGDAPEIRAF